MAHPQIAVFARLADSGAKPLRKIEGQKTLLGRTMHGIAYDEVHDEFFVPAAYAQAVLAFRGAASGEEAPVRIIQGPLTQLRGSGSSRLAMDPIHNEIYVPQGGELLVFDSRANGNVEPIRILQGPEGKDLSAIAVGVDPIHNLLVVGSSESRGNRGGTELLIFNRMAKGNEAPRGIIGGPKSRLTTLTLSGPFAVYPEKGLMFVGFYLGASSDLAAKEAFVGVWSIHDNGDVQPRFIIGEGAFQMPRGVAVNPKHKEVIATDKRLNAVLTFSVPEIF